MATILNVDKNLFPKCFPFFGIPDLDALISRHQQDGKECPSTAVTCIQGPVGCGKSTFALHLASHYFDQSSRPAPIVLFVSSDWAYGRASQTWHEFRLSKPSDRQIHPGPNHSGSTNQVKLAEQVNLLEVHLDSEEDTLIKVLGQTFQPETPTVFYLDLRSTVFGDKWALLDRLTALLPANPALPHLFILDSIAGLETSTGNLDAQGIPIPTDTRIHQLIQLSKDKAHFVYTSGLDEPHIRTRREEAQADFVYTLCVDSVRGKKIRKLLIAKARNCNHPLDEHAFEFRSDGTNSSCQEDADNPRSDYCYIQFFPSCNALLDSIKRNPGPVEPQPQLEAARMAFGVKNLDNLLSALTRKVGKSNGDRFGLKTGELIRLTGPQQSHKTSLAFRFIQYTYAGLFRAVLALLCGSSQGNCDELNGVLGRSKTEWEDIFDLFGRQVEEKELNDKMLSQVFARLREPKHAYVAILITNRFLDFEELARRCADYVLKTYDSVFECAWLNKSHWREALHTNLINYIKGQRIKDV